MSSIPFRGRFSGYLTSTFISKSPFSIFGLPFYSVSGFDYKYRPRPHRMYAGLEIITLHLAANPPVQLNDAHPPQPKVCVLCIICNLITIRTAISQIKKIRWYTTTTWTRLLSFVYFSVYSPVSDSNRTATFAGRYMTFYARSALSVEPVLREWRKKERKPHTHISQIVK